uniref:G domain-containing protein n=1 Tax=Rhizophora mucronata TaxID=61149 RepID=A0A2P2ITK1_RHIMU
MMIISKTLSSSSKSTKLKALLSFPLFTHYPHRHQHQNPTKAPSFLSFTSNISSKPTNSNPPPKKLLSFPSPSLPPSLALIRDGNYDDATPSGAVCPGCGVPMQDSNPKHPGFFTKPVAKDPNYKCSTHLVPVSFESEFPNSLKRGLVISPDNTNSDSDLTRNLLHSQKPIVCARCHSLRHYGKVKDPTIENLLPDFDFHHTVGKRLLSASGARSVVLLVVDAVDFDGSFPKRVAKLVSDAIEENYTAWKQGKSGNVPRIVLVVTKIDLLPTSLSPTGFEHWVRQRAREGGATIIKKVHFVSAVKNWGLKDLVDDVVELAGPRGNVWAVGTQNAGKSTLINAMGKSVGGGDGKICQLTEAPVPGTTLGIVRVEGVLPGQAKLFDTPGLLNPNQISTRLTRDEQKLVHIGKPLKPRTYRIKVSLALLDVLGLMLEESAISHRACAKIDD